MLSKIYLALLAVAVLAMAFFTYYSCSWLQSVGAPAAAIAGYEYHSSLAWTFLWVSLAVLLMAGTAVLWTTRNAWAMWLSFVYFVAFLVMRSFWLERAAMQFRTDNGLATDVFSVGPVFAAMLIVAVATIVVFDQFVIVRIHSKMYPSEPETPAEQPESPAE